MRAQPLLLLILGIAFFAGASTRELRPALAGASDPRHRPAGDSDRSTRWSGSASSARLTMVIGLVASQVLVRRFERVGQARLARLLFAFTARPGRRRGRASRWRAASRSRSSACWLYYLHALADRRRVETTWVNEQITDSSVRATVISMTGQADAIGQVAGGPGARRARHRLLAADGAARGRRPARAGARALRPRDPARRARAGARRPDHDARRRADHLRSPRTAAL